MDALLKKMVVHVEDRRFYSHFGLDLFAILRAFVANLRARRYVQGGSTITQQLARTIYLNQEKTIKRKLNEAIIAIRLEIANTKDHILDEYCRQIYLGHRKDGSIIRGFEEAATEYYGKSCANLTLVQKVSLVAAIKGPNWYRPQSIKNKIRTITILASLYENKIINANDLACPITHLVS